jgi:hypothetical protein
MSLDKGDRVGNDLARSFVVVENVEAVLPSRMVHEIKRYICGQRGLDECVEALVERGVILPGASDQQRRAGRAILLDRQGGRELSDILLVDHRKAMLHKRAQFQDRVEGHQAADKGWPLAQRAAELRPAAGKCPQA